MTGEDVLSRLVYLRVRLLYAEGETPLCRENQARTEYQRYIRYLAPDRINVVCSVSRALRLALFARRRRGCLLLLMAIESFPFFVVSTPYKLPALNSLQ